MGVITLQTYWDTVTLVAGLVFSVLFAGAGHAKDYPVNKMEYRNNGAYEAIFTVRYIHEGESCAIYLRSENKTGDDRSRYDLTLDEFGVYRGDPDACSGPIPEGTEVWGKVWIVAGEGKSCRKDGTRFIYDSDSDNTASYRTGGTTRHNNRCKISDRD